MSNYYVKPLPNELMPERLPHWAVYETTAAGPRLVCLCPDELDAAQIAMLLAQDDERANQQDGAPNTTQT